MEEFVILITSLYLMQYLNDGESKGTDFFPTVPVFLVESEDQISNHWKLLQGKPLKKKDFLPGLEVRCVFGNGTSFFRVPRFDAQAHFVEPGEQEVS